MDWVTALFLSLFQGIAEFLPISSSGHLLLFQTLIGKTTPTSLLFTTFLHLSTMCAILVGLRKTIFSLTKQDLLQIFVGLLPLVPLVFALKWLKPLLSNPQILPFGFIFGGALLLLAEVFSPKIPKNILTQRHKDAETQRETNQSLFSLPLRLCASALNFSTSLKNSTTHIQQQTTSNFWMTPLLIGIGQAISVLPGISRLGTTVAVAMLMGWKREKALIFSLLLSIPTVAGAIVEELIAYLLHPPATETVSSSTLLLCFLVAFGSGLLALQVILKLARQASFKGFALYCIILGTLLLYWFVFHAAT